MPNENDRSRSNRESKPLPWFRFNVARIAQSPGGLRVLGDPALLGMMVQFAQASWAVGEMSEERIRQTCGPNFQQLVDIILTRGPDGGWVLDWLEAERTDEDRARLSRAKGAATANERRAHAERPAKDAERTLSVQSATAERPLSDRSACAERTEIEREVERESGSVPTERLTPPPGGAAPAKKKSEKEPRKGEHVQIVEMFQRAWAEVRCRDVLDAHDFQMTRETDPKTIPVGALYLPVEADWAAAARLWKQAPDLSVIRRRMRNFFDSDAPYMRAGGLALFCSKFSILVEPVMALGGAQKVEG